MAVTYLSPIDLSGNELQNARVQNLAAAPSHAAGRIYFDTVLGYFRVSNGTTWTDLAPGGTDTEAVQDILAAMTSASSVVTATYNDAAGTITLSIANGAVTDAMLGTDISADHFIDGSTNHVFTAADDTKLAGIEALAEVNNISDTNVTDLTDAGDTTLHFHSADRARANHTGTQSADTIVDGSTNHVFTAADDTKLGGIEALADVTDATNVDAAGAVMNSDTTTAGMGFVVDEDNMASDSATKVPTQQSVKAYVDSVAQGLDIKASVRAATAVAGTLASSFENGDVIDGVTLVTGNRILIKNQASGGENGIYTVNATGAPTRATDFDSAADVTGGAFVFVEEGTVNADTGWVMTNNGAIVVGTTALVFTQFSGAGSVTAGAGLTQSGSTLAVGAGTGITVNADDVAIDTSIVARKYSVQIGNGALTSITVTHNLGTRSVFVEVTESGSPYHNVQVDWSAATTNTITLVFAVAPTTNQYNVTVIG